MDLSVTERLMLVNQYKILQRLDPRGEEGYEESIRILTSGYEIFYDDLFLEFTRMPPARSEFVLDVLSLYRRMEIYRQRHPDDYEPFNRKMGRFRGFDDHTESDLLAFTLFLIDVQGKFPEQLPYRGEAGGWRAMQPMVPGYERLLESWKKLGTPNQLTAEHIRALL